MCAPNNLKESIILREYCRYDDFRISTRPTLDGNLTVDNKLSARGAFDGNFTFDNDEDGGGEIGDLLASAAGVYCDTELRERWGTNNTILLTSSNSGGRVVSRSLKNRQ